MPNEELSWKTNAGLAHVGFRGPRDGCAGRRETRIDVPASGGEPLVPLVELDGVLARVEEGALRRPFYSV
jgi:hypothetical protein